jgi:hypothetical protein
MEGFDDSGDMIFSDLDGDGAITDADKTYIGSPLPDFTYGLNLGASWKGFDLTMFFYGSQGNDIYDATVRLDATHTNRPVDYGSANSPRNILGNGSNAAPDQVDVSDFYVKDGSFTKLKVMTIGYSLPKSLTEKLFIDKARVYVTGQNLLVFTDYDGVDPEIGQAQVQSRQFGASQSLLDLGIDRGFYPQPRTMMVGVQLTF